MTEIYIKRFKSMRLGNYWF